MRAKRIFFFCFSLWFVAGSAQQSPGAVVVDSTARKYLVGVDLLSAGLSIFSPRKVVQGSVTTHISGSIYGIAEAGFEKNIYDRNGYDVAAHGPFLKAGALYMLAYDAENRLNGFYGGAKLAASFYQQEYRAVPIRGFGDAETVQRFPESRQSSYWIEALVGGRVQLFDTPFYIDVAAQPRYLLHSTKQENIRPMIVPGFGRSASNFNFGFSWSVAYAF